MCVCFKEAFVSHLSGRCVPSLRRAPLPGVATLHRRSSRQKGRCELF